MPLVRGLVSARTWLAFTHHVAGLGLIPLALVGLPVMAASVRFASGFARAERGRFALLLGQDLPRQPADPRRRYRWKIIAT
ncbi:MAG TPA: sensor domain-containing protein, partial [Trebonia sp.]